MEETRTIHEGSSQLKFKEAGNLFPAVGHIPSPRPRVSILNVWGPENLSVIAGYHSKF